MSYTVYPEQCIGHGRNFTNRSYYYDGNQTLESFPLLLKDFLVLESYSRMPKIWP